MELRDLILSPENDKPVKVDVTEWGTTVYVRALSADDYLEWIGLAFDTEGKFIRKGARGRLLAFCLCDETGKRIFTVDDIAALNNKSAAVIFRLFKIADDLSRLDEEETDKAEKN